MNYKLELKEKGYTGDFSLGSLSDACGEKFFALKLIKEDVWDCHGMGLEPDINMVSKNFRGKTKEEAVSLLWLELNPEFAYLYSSAFSRFLIFI